MLPTSRELGKAGEDAAAKYLEKLGYRILRRNYRTRVGEIDLVALDAGTVVFVEVKSRTSERFGSAAESVGKTRLERLSRAGELFLRENRNPSTPCRIDVLCVRLSEKGEVIDVEQIVNVTQ